MANGIRRAQLAALEQARLAFYGVEMLKAPSHLTLVEPR
jgi:hypothetical protein